MSVHLNAPLGYNGNNLVFEDRFSGTVLDISIWDTYITANAFNGAPWNGTPGGGSGLSAGYNTAYFEPSQIAVNNGLTLTAINSPITARGMNYDYTSGAISTYGKLEFDGGYLQISMKEPAGNGAWPAIWLLPGSASTAGDFEIDMQDGEMGSNPNASINYCLHNNYYITAGGLNNVSANLTSDFHIYGMDWEPGQSITWYLDGIEVGQVVQGQQCWDPTTNTIVALNIPNTPMFLMIDLQVAGSSAASWHTAADGSTPASMAMQVADVQLYQHAGESIAPATIRSLVGGGHRVDLSTLPGKSVIFAGSNGNWDAIWGSAANLTLQNDEISIVGANNVVTATSGSWISLYQTQQGRDTINGVGINVITVSAQAIVYGSTNTIITTPGSTVTITGTLNGWDLVEGSSAVINMNSAYASIVGGGNTINCTRGSIVSLYQTGTNWDTINDSFDSVILTGAHGAVYGGGEIVYAYQKSAVALFQTNGNWDTVYMANETALIKSAQASIFGGGNFIVCDPTSAISLYGTSGNWDTVNASSGSITLNDSQANVYGGSDYIYVYGHSSVNLNQTNGNGDTVVATGESISLLSAEASVIGAGDQIAVNGASTLTLIGSSMNLTFNKSFGTDSIYGFGSGDAIVLSAADWSSFSALIGSGDLYQQGNNAIIELNAANKITLANENVSSLTAAQFVFS